jgi:cytochrome c
MKIALLIAGSILALAIQAQPPANGQALFERRCGGCHAIDRDKEGPRLGGVYGRTAGTVATFQYSDALRKSGIRWNTDSLEKWLTDPERMVPDNNMTFHVESAAERQEIIAWLKQTSRK